MNEFWTKITDFLGTTGARVVLGFGVLFIGLFVIKIVSRIGSISLQKTPIEKTVVSFITSIINIALYLLLAYIVAITMFPGTNAGIVAALSSAALAIGLGLKDSLTNFASGLIIIITKPFKQGDFVQIGSSSGTVEGIGFMSTTLTTPDNKIITLANRNVVGSEITNYSTRPTRRVDLTVSVAYGSDIQKTKEVLLLLANKHPKVLNSPEPMCRLKQYSDSSLDFTFRVWVRNADYWTVTFDLNEEIAPALNANGINIPFNTITIDIPSEEANNTIDKNYKLNALKKEAEKNANSPLKNLTISENTKNGVDGVVKDKIVKDIDVTEDGEEDV